MDEASNGQSEQHHILLDMSLFTFDLLGPDRIAAQASTTPFSLEVPGAFVTMIQYARVGNLLLRDFLYAYLLGIRQEKERSEALGDRIRVLEDVRAEKERLKKEATLAAKRIVEEYAPLIEGALEPPPEHPSEEFPILEDRPGDETSWSRSNLQRGSSGPGYPIRRYEAIDLPTLERLAELRQAYVKELNLPTHPLLDLYFLQVYHSQRIGLAASPSIPRQLISLGRSTYQILSSIIPLPIRRPRGREFWRRVQNADASLEEFLLTYVKDEWRTAAVNQMLGLAISFVYSGHAELVPALVAFGGELVMGAIIKAPSPLRVRRLLMGAATVIALLAVTLLCRYVWLLIQLSTYKPPPPVCPPTSVPEPPLNILSVYTPTPASAFAPTASAEQTPVLSVSTQATDTSFCTYVVQPGDTLQDIAARFQVSEENLRATNNLSGSGTVRMHQMLIVSAPCCRPIGGQGISHIVHDRETLYSLARRYGTRVENIARANHIYDINYIQIGQMLCMPSTEMQ